MTEGTNVVLGMDVLINNPEILSPRSGDKKIADHIRIPIGYLEEIASKYGENSERGDACKKLTSILMDILPTDENGHKLKNGTLFHVEEEYSYGGFEELGLRQQAISLATNCHGKKIPIMTGDERLRLLAVARRIMVKKYGPDIYTGRRIVNLPSTTGEIWTAERELSVDQWRVLFPNESPLKVNEFVEFSGYSTKDLYWGVGRFDGQSLKAIKPPNFNELGITKRVAKNTGQIMLLDALLALPKDIPIVVVMGEFGTGKTFLTVLAGLFKTKGGEYEKVFICPSDSNLGKDIGYIPGDVTEKTLPKSKPIIDNLRSISRQASKPFDVEAILEKHFEFEPVILMGGRSIENSFIIFDEFQDTNRRQAKALLTRVGNGSKVVMLGDPNQLTNPYLDQSSNGLSYAASKLAGKKEVAIVTFRQDEIVRSNAAITISECL